MSVNAVDATRSASAERKTTMAENFDTFLKLLTTQLANQDPLSPMDSNQFTQQLVQFASVEQSVATNSKLDAILGLVRTDGIGAGAGYLGREVEADGATLSLARTGTGSFRMSLEEKPATLFVNVLNESGERVARLAPPPAVGPQTVVWDGRGEDGFRQPAGIYRVAVEATDKAGTPIEVSTKLTGTVTAVENDDGRLFLHLDERRIALEDVLAVRQPAPASPDEGAAS